MKNQVQLIAYVDRLSGGGLHDLRDLLEGTFAGLFGGIHLLPFFHPIDGADAGFDPIDHTQVDPRLGTWADVHSLSRTCEVVADLIVNHVSTGSPQFQDYLQHGSRSEWAGMFLTFDRVFPHGAAARDLLAIYRPRPGLPLTKVALRSGETALLWTTFTPQQVDIDVASDRGAAYLNAILERFHAAGVRAIRLDAAGYAIKKPGTSCFMIPETFDFIAALAARAREFAIEVLVEIHSHYLQQVEIARHVDWVYDFALPPLVLHALFARDVRPLVEWLRISPRSAFTVLDTHDGIGVIDAGADASDPAARPGLLPPAAIDRLVETIHERSRGESRQATGAAASNLDLYQVNCTYYDALGRRDREYLTARAIQFFAPGIPQVYYTGLLAGHNDLDLLARTRVGRDINRHYYSRAEVESAAARPVVRELFELIRFRNTHPAFAGEFHVESASPETLRMEWRYQSDYARLDVDLGAGQSAITRSAAGQTKTRSIGRDLA